MLNFKHILQRYEIRTTNITFAVADTAVVVGEAPDPKHKAKNLFGDLLGVYPEFSDNVYARIAAKRMIQLVAQSNYQVDPLDVPALLTDVYNYTDVYVTDPKNSHLWSSPDENNPAPVAVHVVKGLDCKVVLNENGKIKKGGKQVLSKELYIKYVTEAAVPMTNQEFIKVLMDELDMTKQGSTTYAYNMRKQAKIK